MPSIESWGQTNTPEAAGYLSVDPQTLGRLRILRIGDVELQSMGTGSSSEEHRFTWRTRNS
jgi:hypothetical protein